MTTRQKKRVNYEKILAIVLTLVAVVFLVSVAIAKIDKNVTDYKVMREQPKVEVPQIQKTEENIKLPSKMESSEKPLSQREQILEKSGLNIGENRINWTLAEGLGALVEYRLGSNAKYYEGYDYAEIQQVTTKGIVNQLRSKEYPNHFYYLVKEDTQNPDEWEYVCTHHYRVSDETMINVLKVLYHKPDYDIPDNIYYEFSFPYEEGLEEATEIYGESTPAVSDSYQATEWLTEQSSLSDSLYPYSSYIYDDGTNSRLIIFCGSSADPS